MGIIDKIFNDSDSSVDKLVKLFEEYSMHCPKCNIVWSDMKWREPKEECMKLIECGNCNSKWRLTK